MVRRKGDPGGGAGQSARRGTWWRESDIDNNNVRDVQSIEHIHIRTGV